jgi:hypothetical protein
MNDYVTVILSRDEAIDLCRTIETIRVFLVNKTFERVYNKIMKDLSRENVKEKVEDVR